MAAPTPRPLLFVPMYNCAPQIGRTLAQVAPTLASPDEPAPLLDRFGEVFVVDNGSTDGGAEKAADALRSLGSSSSARLAGEARPSAASGADVRRLVVRNDRNYHLGGSHKVAFERCLDAGHAGVVVFHGDDQGRLADLMDALPADVAEEPAECVLGARFMPGSSLQGYAAHRIAANVAFNALFSAVTRRALWDLGSGLNYYSRRFLERGLWRTCRDDLTFNYDLILRTCAAGSPIRFVPISWREDDQISNAKLWKHGRTTLRTVARYAAGPKKFVDADRSGFEGRRTWTALYDSATSAGPKTSSGAAS